MLKETSVIYERYNPQEPAVVVQTAGINFVHHPRIRRIIKGLGIPFEEFTNLLQTKFEVGEPLLKVVPSSIGNMEVAKIDLPRQKVIYTGITNISARKGFEAIYVLSGRATLTFPESFRKDASGVLIASTNRLNADIQTGALAVIPSQTAYGLSWVGSNFSYISLRTPKEEKAPIPVSDLHPTHIESHRYLSDTRFTATRDMADSLRLDSSVINAGKQEDVVRKSLQIQSVLMARYGKYMRPYTLEEQGGIEHRVLVTDKNTYLVLFSEMGSDTETTKSIGTVYREGALTNIIDPRQIWEGLSDDNKEALKQCYPTVFQFQEGTLIMLLAHEMVHQYQAQQLPRPFFESGARYYTRAILQTLHYPYIENEVEKVCLKYYEDLVEKYGDTVHEIFFGSINEYEWYKIIDMNIPTKLQEIVDNGNI